MIKKIMLILFCSIILFPAFILADGANKLEVGEKIRINTGSWILAKAIEKGDSNQYIGYKGLDHFRDYDGAYVIFSQYYIDTEFQPIKYRDNIKVICIGPYAFKPLEIRPQFIRLEYLGSCLEIFPVPKDNVLEVKDKTDKTNLIRK